MAHSTMSRDRRKPRQRHRRRLHRRLAQDHRHAQALFKQPGYGQFSAVLYYRSGDYAYPNCRWWADTSSTSLASMKAVATHPYHGGSP